jgi:hypothetical protein
MALSIDESGSRREFDAPASSELATSADDLDHYHVESEAVEARAPIVGQILWVLRILLLLAIAALSLAVFWIIGMMIGIL